MDDTLAYLAGQFDGDGCVLVRLPSKMQAGHGFVAIEVDKSVKNVASLHCFHEHFGGWIKTPRKFKNPNWHDSQKWVLQGSAALVACTALSTYSTIKRNQLQLALQLPTQDTVRCAHVPVVGTHRKTGEVKQFGTITEASNYIGSASVGNVHSCCHGKQKSCKGWTFCLGKGVDIEILDGKIVALKEELSSLKRTGAIYRLFGGFFDAEGCIICHKKHVGVTLSISQKYPAILLQIQKQYGGSVTAMFDKGGLKAFSWHLHAGSKALLRQVLPHLIEKRRQAELALSNTTTRRVTIHAAITLLKGNQGKRSSVLCKASP